MRPLIGVVGLADGWLDRNGIELFVVVFLLALWLVWS